MVQTVYAATGSSVSRGILGSVEGRLERVASVVCRDQALICRAGSEESECISRGRWNDRAVIRGPGNRHEGGMD